MADNRHTSEKNKQKKIDSNMIDAILQETISNIQDGRKEIFEISETARNEFQQLEEELNKAKKQTAQIIQEVDDLEKKSYHARVRLVKVSKDFHRFSEEDIKEAYEEASELKVRLTIMKEREQQMRTYRDSLERRIRNLNNTIKKAENVMNQLGVIESYLSKGFGDIQETLEDLEKRKDFGLKIIRAQEEERRRVAREIHDGPAQSLANMVLRTEYCEKLIDTGEKNNSLKEELSDLKEQVRTNLKDVRKIIFDLRPMTLDDLGLVPAIRRLIQDVEEEADIEGELKVFGEEFRLDRDLEIALFRTAQEALNNVKKHSRAKRFWVKTEFTYEKVQIVVRDDGIGFDMSNDEETLDGHHFGLSNMKERVQSLGGEIIIQSRKREGTRVSIKVPISEAELSKEGGGDEDDGRSE